MFKTPLSPQPTNDGAFIPSSLALRLSVSGETDFEPTEYADAYTGGDLKVLVICTEERDLTMANGKKFSTGNHPVELLLPLMHITNAGFDIDVITPTGAPAQLEMWAMPEKDEAVMKFYASLKSKLDKPGSVADFVANSMTETSPYVAVFLPGGHGAMLGLPENKDVGRIVRWCQGRDLHMVALCHGSAAMLAASLPGLGGGDFVYEGYDMVAFPDKADRQSPRIGYMPGQLPWHMGERFATLGVTILNTKADDSTHTDRKLLSGASPAASNNLGKLAARTLLDEVHQKSNQHAL